MTSYLEKRSMMIAGKRTSLALEPDFWSACEAIAKKRGLSMPQMFALIDKARDLKQDGQSLASAVRCYVLNNALNRAAAL